MDGGAVTRPKTLEWTHTRWCPSCRTSVVIRVEMLTHRPASGSPRANWIDAAIREAEAKFEVEHAATCGRTK